MNDRIADGLDRYDVEKLEARAESAEAELALAKPLLEAVEKWDGEGFLWDDVGKSALAYRKGKEDADGKD